MNEADAADLGLADGADVIAECDRGALCACLRVTSDIAPGSVAIEGKWWWTDAIDGAAVANRLCEGAWTPVGQPAYNDIHVTVRSAGT